MDNWYNLYVHRCVRVCVCVCSVVRECIKSNHTCICSTLLTCECMQVLLCSVDCRGMFVPQCKCVCNNLCFIHALCIHTLWLGASFKECKILPVRERTRICCRNSALKHCIAKLQQLQNNKYNHTLTYTTHSHTYKVHTYIRTVHTTVRPHPTTILRPKSLHTR